MGMYLHSFALPTQPSAVTDQNSDHFDQKVEASLRRDLPIITTTHAQAHLTAKGADSFTSVSALDPFEQVLVDIDGALAKRRGSHPRMRVTGMPGKHVPPNPIVEKLNALSNAVGSSVLSVSVLTSVRSRLRTAGCSN
jgi:flavin reductase (DIM6/NTAB) family NADH-FMN oxidoreductase RutF